MTWLTELNPTLCLHRSEDMKILNVSFPRVVIEPTTFTVTLVPLRHDCPQSYHKLYIILIKYSINVSRIWKTEFLDTKPRSLCLPCYIRNTAINSKKKRILTTKIVWFRSKNTTLQALYEYLLTVTNSCWVSASVLYLAAYGLHEYWWFFFCFCFIWTLFVNRDRMWRVKCWNFS